MSKPKYNKVKCKKCCFRVSDTSAYRTDDGDSVSCNYSTIMGKTCLRRGEHGTVIDIRGNDYDNCLLFKEGDSLRKGVKGVIL